MHCVRTAFQPILFQNLPGNNKIITDIVVYIIPIEYDLVIFIICYLEIAQSIDNIVDSFFI